MVDKPDAGSGLDIGAVGIRVFGGDRVDKEALEDEEGDARTVEGRRCMTVLTVTRLASV